MAQGVQDLGHGLPNVLTTKEGEVGRISALALHRVQDVTRRQAVRDARVVVVDTVGRGRMHQARAIAFAHVVGQIDRGQTIVGGIDMRQRVSKLDPIQGLALGRGQNLAVQTIALQASRDPRGRQQQHAALGLHQGVFDVRVGVQGLVGRDGPGRRGPDHRVGVAGQLFQSKGLRQSFGLRAQEGHIQRVALFVGVLDLELGQR